MEKDFVLATDDDFIIIEPAPTPVLGATGTMKRFEPQLTTLTTFGKNMSTMMTMSTAPNPDGDFEKDSNMQLKYTGTAEYVEIPHRVNGEILTDYSYMFENNATVKAVKSTNPNVKYMIGMFQNFRGIELDLSEMDVSNVTHVGYMFRGTTSLITLNIDGWDTSNMSGYGGFMQGSALPPETVGMFEFNDINGFFEMVFVGYVTTGRLDLRNVDISKVKNMRWLFQSAEIDEVDLTSFNFDHKPNLYRAFQDAKINRLYVGTQADKNHIMASSSFPINGVTVIVHPGGRVAPKSHLQLVKEYTESKEIPALYNTEKMEAANMGAGTEVVLTHGVDGIKMLERRVRAYSSGVKEYEIITDTTTKDSITEVVKVGTKISDEFFVLATDDDFVSQGYEGFKYIGLHKLVEIPHMIKGRPITMFTSGMFTGSGVIGVKSTNLGLTEIDSAFLDVGSETLDLSRIDFSNVKVMSSLFGGYARFRTLNLSGADLTGIRNAYGLFQGLNIETFDLSGVKFPSYTQNMFDSGFIEEIIVLSSEEEAKIRGMDNYGLLDYTTFTIKSAITVTNEYTETEEHIIPFNTTETEDSDLKVGVIITDIEGIDGIKELTYVVTEYSDGSTERDLISETIIKEPINKELRVGTNTVEHISWSEVEEIVPQTTETIEDSFLPVGREEVYQLGSDGLDKVRYKNTYHYDGKVDKEEQQRTSLIEMKPKIIYIGTATVKSVEEKVVESVVPYITQYEDDPTLYVGEEKQKQQGVNGYKIETQKITTYLNGVQDVEVVSVEQTDAVMEIIRRGTKLETDTDIVRTPIPYKTEKIPAPHLPYGQEELIQSGKEGERREVYEVIIIADGTSQRTLIAEQTTPPISRIVRVGTATWKHWVTEVYLFDAHTDRTYFVDKYKSNPVGLSERFDITLKDRPVIPTAQMRYGSDVVLGKPGDVASEDNYDNVEIDLFFNFIADNPKAVYGTVSNALGKMGPGTRLRFSDDTEGTFRELARIPSIQPLNNDLRNWGDFVVRLTLKPFRYIEEKEREIKPGQASTLKQPLPNAMKTPQLVEHLTERNIDITLKKNGTDIYTIENAKTKVVITNAELLHTYGGKKEW